MLTDPCPFLIQGSFFAAPGKNIMLLDINRIFGGTLLVAWQWGLYREIIGRQRLADVKAIRTAMLAAGAILPWIALDIPVSSEPLLGCGFPMYWHKYLC